MVSFKQFISESINDKGILKAVFIIGLPGAGKSYTASKLNGTVSPRIVNTDKATEHLGKVLGIEADPEYWNLFKDKAHKITSSALSNYLNSMLPLFIDGTSNDASNILHRIGILESLGYDIGIIHVATPLDVAKARVEERNSNNVRKVSMDFIEHVHSQSEENAQFLKSKVNFFRTITNNSDELGNKEINEAFKAVQKFFDQPVSNPVGKRIIEKLQQDKQAYLTPSIMSIDNLKKKVQGWYKS